MECREVPSSVAARLFRREEIALPHRPILRWFPVHGPDLEEAPDAADDPWAGEDARWDEAEERPAGPADVVRFFRGLVLAVAGGLLFWAALVYLVVRLVT